MLTFQKKNEKLAEIAKQKKRLEDLQKLNLRIEAKKEKMKVYDDFLKKVLEHNADEFPEVNDIVSRYKTLKHSNDKLKSSQLKDEKDIEILAENKSFYKKEQTTKMVKQGGTIASKQQQLE